MTQPLWSVSIIEEVCKEYKRALPRTRWIQRERKSSSGVYYPHNKTMVLCLGRDGYDHLQIFLHELSHHLVSRRRKVGHNKKFWVTLKALLIRYDCYTEEFVKREHNYKGKAQLYL